jgi:hypothetical protein
MKASRSRSVSAAHEPGTSELTSNAWTRGRVDLLDPVDLWTFWTL